MDAGGVGTYNGGPWISEIKAPPSGQLASLRLTDLPFETTSGGKSAALGRLLLCSTNTPVWGSLHEETAAAATAAAFWASMCAWSSSRKCAREEREWSALSTTRIWWPENLGGCHVVGEEGMWGSTVNAPCVDGGHERRRCHSERGAMWVLVAPEQQEHRGTPKHDGGGQSVQSVSWLPYSPMCLTSCPPSIPGLGCTGWPPRHAAPACWR